LDSICNILSYLSTYFFLVPLIIGLYFKKHLKYNDKIILSLIILSGLTELANYLFALFIKKENIVIVNTYVILETILIGLFFFSVSKSKYFRLIIALFTLCFIVFSIHHIIENNYGKLNYISLVVESISFSFFSIIIFHQILKYSIYSNIIDAPLFWYNSALLFYFIGNIFLNIFSNYLMNKALYSFFVLWGVWHSSLNIIFYILISIGFWKTKTSQR
jgi:hypothetical protein